MLVQEDKNYPETPFREIELRTEQVVLVDPELWNWLNSFNWFLKRSFCRAYVVRTETIKGKKVFIRMHRIVAKTPANMVCHHINGNPLDNRITNLQNMTWYDHTKLHSYR